MEGLMMIRQMNFKRHSLESSTAGRVHLFRRSTRMMERGARKEEGI
jgi:hypothetical protein